jgi:hypothetical protein
MALTHVWTNTVKVPGLPSLPADAPVTIVGDYAVDVEQSCAAGVVTEIDVGTITFSQIQSIVLHTDQVNVTVKTNSTGAPGNTFSLGSGKALGWNNTLSYSNPVTSNITKFFVDNTAGAKTTLFRAGVLLVS